jgi:cardiolipin synthase
MFHCKVMVVDDAFTSLGSTNFDNRSFQLNEEVNLNVFDEAFAVEQARIFTRDLERSEQVTYEAWRNRSWREKTAGWVAKLFRREL